MTPTSGPIGSVRTTAVPGPEMSSGSSAMNSPMVGVVLVDRGDELHLALGLRDRLAHLQRDQLGQLLGLLTVDVGGPGQHGAALSSGVIAPGAVRRRAACDEVVQFGIRDLRVLRERSPVDGSMVV